MYSRTKNVCFFLLPLWLLISCATPQPMKPGGEYPASLKVAVQSIANQLMGRVREGQGFFDKSAETRILIDPFLDADSLEKPVVSQEIEEIFIRTGRENFGFSVTPLTSENLTRAEYVINGFIRLDDYKDGQTGFKKLYRIFAVVRDIRQGRIMTSTDAWIADAELNYKPVREFGDSPVYQVGQNTGEKADIQKKLMEDENYLDQLEIKAILNDAGAAYEKGNYQEALDFYRRTLELPKGNDLRTYTGLYMCYLRTGDKKAAEDAFGQLLEASIARNNSITVKLMFKVNSIEFWDDPGLKEQYDIWLRKIGEYFSASSKCLKIAGHCSKTGPEGWNNRLSLARSRRIQSLLRPWFPEVFKRSEAVGKGFQENVVGTGTDDERDALDRRVEFIVVDCP